MVRQVQPSRHRSQSLRNKIVVNKEEPEPCQLTPVLRVFIRSPDAIVVLRAPHLNLHVDKLVEDVKVKAILLECDNDHVKVLVQVFGGPVCVV